MTLMFSASASAKEPYETDIIKTSADDLKITFIGHGTLMFTFGTKVIHVDPYTNVADFAKFPKADVILITHEHRDRVSAENFIPLSFWRHRHLEPYEIASRSKGDWGANPEYEISGEWSVCPMVWVIMVEQVKSVDFRTRRAKHIERVSDELLANVLSILDACIY